MAPNGIVTLDGVFVVGEGEVLWAAIKRSPSPNSAALSRRRLTGEGAPTQQTDPASPGRPAMPVLGPKEQLVPIDRVSATRRIAAPAHKIFLIVSHPSGHVEIDGSGMLQAAPNAEQLTAVGETFEMDMDRRPLGDIPNMGAYKVRCTVTKIVPDRLFEWAVRAVDKSPAGHVYGWQIEPISDTECEVTNYCDWTNISDQLRAKFSWPVVPVDRLEKSVEKLERIATQP